jgi:hypothetical protein
VSEHAGNVDRFRHRPVHAVAALLPDPQSAEFALGDLQSAGIDIEHVRMLYGEEGVHILAVYDDWLRSGQALMTVPCAPEQRYEVGNGLRARGAHSIIYFGRASAETLSGP